jgi:hypothetical protein
MSNNEEFNLEIKQFDENMYDTLFSEITKNNLNGNLTKTLLTSFRRKTYDVDLDNHQLISEIKGVSFQEIIT